MKRKHIGALRLVSGKMCWLKLQSTTHSIPNSGLIAFVNELFCELQSEFFANFEAEIPCGWIIILLSLVIHSVTLTN